VGKIRVKFRFRQTQNINKLFLEFLNFGQRPFFIENKYSERIENIIEKTIYTDIPYFLPNLNKNHLSSLRSIVSHLSSSAIPTINIQNLCNQWEIGKDKVYELLSVLEASGIINIIYNTLTPKGTSKGDKILFQDCSFYSALHGDIGNRRESYFTSVLKCAKYNVLTSKNEEMGDFQVNKILFEIGGKSKSIKKSDLVIKETLDDIYTNEWPLWVFGFLW
jgi:predicted AAA+ superfamily ATPase